MDTEIARARAFDIRSNSNPMNISALHIKDKYGLDLSDYNEMLYEQGSKCAICMVGFDFHTKPQVDHNHQTGEVRGLLCSKCNRAIYLLQDDPTITLRASKYLGFD